MRVAVKVAGGAGLLVGLLAVVLFRDQALMRRLATAHRALVEVRVVAVTSTLEILRTLEVSEERLQKLFVTRDPAYAAQLDRLGHAIEEQLDVQQRLDLPALERETAAALLSRWRQYQAAFEEGRIALLGTRTHSEDAHRDLVAAMESVRAQALLLLQVVRGGLEEEVGRSLKQVDEGERQSQLFAAAAVLCALLFVAATIRSINRPLARLIQATRALTAGRFVRLDPRGKDELAELGRAFDAMVERLQESEQVKRDFLSRVSHELKTPLAAMQETNQLLVDELAGPLTPKQRRLLQLNLDAGRRLSVMLSRLLDLSRLEAGAVCYDVRPVDLGRLMGEAVQQFEARLQEKQLHAELSLAREPVVVDGDQDWLMQVLVNLLENAVKFSPPGKRIELGLRSVQPQAVPATWPEPARALARRGPCALVTVADEGPGIPPEAKDRIFVRFYQVDRSRRAGGVGLGLAICRDIVAAHGGALWMDNRPEGGSLFSVALPLAAGAAASLEPSAAGA